MELGGVGRPDTMGFSGSTVGDGQRKMGERAEWWGPCVSMGREREDTKDGRHKSKRKTYFQKYAKG
jgi:hypothetical protein